MTAIRYPEHPRSAVTLVAAVVVVLLSGCTGKYISSPVLTLSDESTTPRSAIETLFLSQGDEFAIELLEADETSGRPLGAGADEDPVDGLSARGVGGLFVPLVLDVDLIRASTPVGEPDRIVFETEWEAIVNGIPAVCDTPMARVIPKDDGGVNIEFNSFYCNWFVIGNVVTDMSLSIDYIDLEQREFTGYYKLTFFGTGNATGSGYYRARIRPVADQSSGSLTFAAEATR